MPKFNVGSSDLAVLDADNQHTINVSSVPNSRLLKKNYSHTTYKVGRNAEDHAGLTAFHNLS